LVLFTAHTLCTHIVVIVVVVIVVVAAAGVYQHWTQHFGRLAAFSSFS